MEINYLAIGEKIKKYRKEQKIPQQKLAKIIGISSSHMCNIEKGRTKFGLSTLMTVAAALKVNTDLLLYEQISKRGKMRAIVLDEIEAQLRDCNEVQMQMLREFFHSEKKRLTQLAEEIKEDKKQKSLW